MPSSPDAGSAQNGRQHTLPKVLLAPALRPRTASCSPFSTMRPRHVTSRLVRLSLAILLLMSLAVTPGAAVAATVAPTSTSTTASVAGQIVVQPQPTFSIASINARYQTTTVFQFTDSSVALLRTSDLNGTLALMALDSSIAWFEANNSARQPAAKDDSGADPYCGTATVTASTGTTAKDDSGADPYCTHTVTNSVG